ncbi:MAG: 3-phosphoshikimate 1-carboxyvinyltransferase [Candidatus Omnitrophica bacterium]|nr:3-phosphoshikimate 1-carboxyvinyltransferase [Candidatus Omnitrophota bacterium]
MDWEIRKIDKPLKGGLSVPADKSISHRAIMFSSIAKGVCRIENFLLGEDCLCTLNAFKRMGITIEISGNTVTVMGKGLKGLSAPKEPLNMGNSGTTIRIISGILAGQDFSAVLEGDESLSSRPMKRIMEPLGLMGTKVEDIKGGKHAPLRITGSAKPLKAIKYSLPVPSAQVKSCVLAAGLYADGITTVTEPFQSRDHTERMLEYFSADIKRKGLSTEINGLKELKARDIVVPGDISSAAFFLVGASILKGSDLTLKGVGLNPTRRGILDVLKRMNADIRIINEKGALENAGDIIVKYSDLFSTTVEEDEIPFLIDEIPVLTVAAIMAKGTTVFKGIKELKVKETDRVKTMIENLGRMGYPIREENNSLIIQGKQRKLNPVELDSFGDHRIAMSMAIAALTTGGDCRIKNTSCVDTSYPGFLSDLKKLSNW